MSNSILVSVCAWVFVAVMAGQAAAQEIVLRPGATAKTHGGWTKVADTSAAGKSSVAIPERHRAKVATALKAPADYFEMRFTAKAKTAYRLWFRGKAASNSYSADSAYVQFSGSVTSSGSPSFRIGSTAATVLVLEDCSGCGVSGWGWNDNYYGKSTGSLIYFAKSGTQTIRVQSREDGLAIDQIVLSPAQYRSASPGAAKHDTTILDPETASSTAPPSASGGKTLKVMHWNLHHGVGSDGKYDISRIATWIARINPDIVSLNEVEKYTGWGNEHQPARYESMLESKTGRKWYAVWAQEYGQWGSNGKGNLLLSRYPFTNTARYELSHERTVALGQVVVNGRNITVATTHLDPDSASRRYTQSQQLVSWLKNFSQNRIVVGDMNAQPTSKEMTFIKNAGFRDAWADAKAGGYAHAAGDNRNGYTRRSRIDILYTSTGASHLKTKRVEVVDTRDSKGQMPSDHRPLVTTYEVR